MSTFEDVLGWHRPPADPPPVITGSLTIDLSALEPSQYALLVGGRVSDDGRAVMIDGASYAGRALLDLLLERV